MAVLAEHRVSRRGPEPVRVDHVAVADHDAALAFRLFEGLGRERFNCEAVLACTTADRPAGGDAEERACLEHAARHRGALLARDGRGPIHRLYAACLAAPGRIVLGTEPRLCASGGLGTLAFMATPLEIAAALAGAPVSVPTGEVVPLRLHGKPPAWLSGEDVAIELRRRLGASPARGAMLEFELAEPDSLPVSARMAIAREAPRWGATTALFPSDELVRSFLKAQGRESDWKPLPGRTEAAASHGVDLDFSDLEPLIVRPTGEIVPLREMAGTPVRSVWVGPEADPADLARLAAALAGGARSGVEITVTIGSRDVHLAAARAGTIAALRAAGVTLKVGGVPAPPTHRSRDGLSMACAMGAGAGAGDRHTGRHAAGLDSCTAAARAGVVADPRGLSLPPAADHAPEDWRTPRLPARSSTAETGSGVESSPETVSAGGFGKPILGPMRGTVLLHLGDRVGVDDVLPWGPRVRMSRLRVDDLIRFAFSGRDPGLAARAGAHGGGWIVAGRDFGVGEWREQVGLVAARLGIGVVLARSYDADFRLRLLQHGILALRFVTGGDSEDVRAGDELELPDLPEGLEPGKPLVVRNLTRGAPYALHHDLDEAAIDRVSAGGLLAWAARGEDR